MDEGVINLVSSIFLDPEEDDIPDPIVESETEEYCDFLPFSKEFLGPRDRAFSWDVTFEDTVTPGLDEYASKQALLFDHEIEEKIVNDKSGLKRGLAKGNDDNAQLAPKRSRSARSRRSTKPLEDASNQNAATTPSGAGVAAIAFSSENGTFTPSVGAMQTPKAPTRRRNSNPAARAAAAAAATAAHPADASTNLSATVETSITDQETARNTAANRSSFSSGSYNVSKSAKKHSSNATAAAPQQNQSSTASTAAGVAGAEGMNNASRNITWSAEVRSPEVKSKDAHTSAVVGNVGLTTGTVGGKPTTGKARSRTPHTPKASGQQQETGQMSVNGAQPFAGSYNATSSSSNGKAAVSNGLQSSQLAVSGGVPSAQQSVSATMPSSSSSSSSSAASAVNNTVDQMPVIAAAAVPVSATSFSTPVTVAQSSTTAGTAAAGPNAIQQPSTASAVISGDGKDAATAAQRCEDGTETPPGITTNLVNEALIGVDGRVGAYTKEERQIKIEKFRERKRARIWRKQIKYDCRKRLADTRPRVKGRFVSRKGEDGNPLPIDSAELNPRDGIESDNNNHSNNKNSTTITTSSTTIGAVKQYPGHGQLSSTSVGSAHANAGTNSNSRKRPSKKAQSAANRATAAAAAAAANISIPNMGVVTAVTAANVGGGNGGASSRPMMSQVPTAHMTISSAYSHNSLYYNNNRTTAGSTPACPPGGTMMMQSKAPVLPSSNPTANNGTSTALRGFTAGYNTVNSNNNNNTTVSSSSGSSSNAVGNNSVNQRSSSVAPVNPAASAAAAGYNLQQIHQTGGYGISTVSSTNNSNNSSNAYKSTNRVLKPADRATTAVPVAATATATAPTNSSVSSVAVNPAGVATPLPPTVAAPVSANASVNDDAVVKKV